MCITGIKGESHDAEMKSKGCIDVEGWSWGQTNLGIGHAGGGHGAGKVVAQDIHFVMKMNKASPDLFLACATGKHIPSAVLIGRKAGG